MIRNALAYASHRPGGVRWDLLAVSRTKGPIKVEGIAEHGVHSATSDPNVLRQMWAPEPDANIGVRCADFGVLDIDPRNGGHLTVNAWGSALGDLPRTWEAATGSGGTHLYFRHAPQLADLPLGKIADGVDYKANGKHYVLVPPSRSKSGPYRWIVRPTECELAAPPPWLLELIIRKKRKQPNQSVPVDMSKYAGVDRVERARGYAKKIPIAVSESGGHDATIRAACLIARGFALSPAEAFDVLSEWNRHCEPPWSDSDLKRKIAETLDHGDAPIGFLLERGRRAA